MKKNSKTNVIMLSNLLILFVLATTYSCNTGIKKEDPKVVAEEANDDKFNTIKSEKDAQFLVNAAEMNYEQIKLGELAQVNGNLEEIKNQGKIMETYHNKSLTNLIGLASEKSISIPTSITDEGQDNYEILYKLKGVDFDKAYGEQMLEHHKQAIEVYETATQNVDDEGIKQWATSELAELRTHFDDFVQLEKDKVNQ